MNRVHGWFSDNKTWIEFIIATVVLWLNGFYLDHHHRLHRWHHCDCRSVAADDGRHT